MSSFFFRYFAIDSKKALGYNWYPMTDQQIRQSLVRYIKKQNGHKLAAQALDISQGYLSDILSGRRAIPDDVLAAIGLGRRTIVYKLSKSGSGSV